MTTLEITAWISIIFVIISGFWTYDRYSHDRLNRKCSEMLNKTIYDNDQKHQKEMVQEKHDRIIESIDNRIKPIEYAILRIENYIKEKLK